MEKITKEELERIEKEESGFCSGHIPPNTNLGHMFKILAPAAKSEYYKTYCGIKVKDFVDKIQEVNCEGCLSYVTNVEIVKVE